MGHHHFFTASLVAVALTACGGDTQTEPPKDGPPQDEPALKADKGVDVEGKVITIGTLDAATLGGNDLTALDVTDATNARTSIESIDSAISAISTSRGSLGAVQNRLESTIRNLQVSTENLSASESRIRDTDMAAEMVQFTKNQILQQAGTAMLGQANAIPQNVLRLLG